MVKNLRLLSLAALLGAFAFFTACNNDDDGGIVINPGSGGSFNVSDGIYLAKVANADTTVELSKLLEASNVEDEGFGTKSRSGYLTGFMFLTPGSYVFIDVEDKESAKVMGGTADMFSDDDANNTDQFEGSYLLIEGVSTSSNTFDISTEGFYHVIFDSQTDEAILVNIQSWGAIGGAIYSDPCTSVGFSSDVDLDDEITADGTGAAYKGTGMIVKGTAADSKFKFRYNNSWKIDRRIDPAAGYGDDNGYVALTNFGGTLETLLEGGADISTQDNGINDGSYDITIQFDEFGVPSIDMNRTGDAPDCDNPWQPADIVWGVVGDATANGWPTDTDATDRILGYVGEIDGADTWMGVVTLAETGVFKIRQNRSWTMQHGGSLPADGSEITLSGGGDIPTPGAGAYFITIKTNDEGTTYTISMTTDGWGVIGEGSPQGNWDADTDMVSDGFTGGVSSYSITGDFTTAGWKMRAGNGWTLQFGAGSIDANLDFTLNPSGGSGNFSFAEAGNYTVTLNFDGENYTASAVKNN